MNIETLRTKVSGVIDSECYGAEFYFLLATDDTFALRRADLTSEAQTALTDSFVEALQSAMNVSSIMGISAADDRTDCIYHYDIQHVPEQLFQLSAVLDARPEQSPQQGHRRLYPVASGSPGKNSRRRRKHKFDADDQSVSRYFLETAKRRFSAIRTDPPLLREPGEGCCGVAYSSSSLNAFYRQMKTPFPQ